MKNMGRGRGRGRGKEKDKASFSIPEDNEMCDSTDESMSSSDTEMNIIPSSSSGRRRQLPAQFRDAEDK